MRDTFRRYTVIVPGKNHWNNNFDRKGEIPKYLAVLAHQSQGGTDGFIGEWIRKDEFFHYLNDCERSEFVRMFEALADIADDDAALAEMQDLGLF